ncbi:MAG TPA: response regulator, partial [Blastocatellia bacterium]|nr:response regulator [Blastocatellia bacterium]
MKPFILIIEDDPDIAESIRYNLEREGAFAAQIALTGEEGLNVALGKGQTRRAAEGANSAPDLLILDLNLPGMSGFELCRRFRTEELTRRMPIIVLTARTEETDKVRGLELGADDYMTKPFSVRELIARVRAALRRSGKDLTVVTWGRCTLFCAEAAQALAAEGVDCELLDLRTIVPY